jgi:hypothetical protein
MFAGSGAVRAIGQVGSEHERLQDAEKRLAGEV